MFQKRNFEKRSTSHPHFSNGKYVTLYSNLTSSKIYFSCFKFQTWSGKRYFLTERNSRRRMMHSKRTFKMNKNVG